MTFGSKYEFPGGLLVLFSHNPGQGDGSRTLALFFFNLR